MKVLIENFGLKIDKCDNNSILTDCISVDDCGSNTCDCEYNCYSDDDCTSDTDR